MCLCLDDCVCVCDWIGVFSKWQCIIKDERKSSCSSFYGKFKFEQLIVFGGRMKCEIN